MAFHRPNPRQLRADPIGDLRHTIEPLESRRLLAVTIPSMPSDLAPKLNVDLWNAAQSARLKVNHPLFTTKLARLGKSGELGLYVHTSGNPKSVANSLKKLGAKVTAIVPEMGVIDITISPSDIGRVARVAGVKAVGLPDYMVTNVTSEGDGALNADDVRNQFATAGLNASGIDGTGIKIGVISDGVNHRSTVQAEGELPAINVDPTRPGSGDEGTAMLEIVHDLAPGAQLYFSGPSTSATMVQSINWLAAQGCDVIVDDLSFFGESYFSDSAIAQAAANVVANGTVYLSAAGNYSNGRHYQAQFTPGASFQGGVMHRFSGTDDSNDIFVPAGDQVIVYFEWSDAWNSTPAASDYRIYITSSTGTVLPTATIPFVTGTPFRAIGYTSSSSRTVQVRIVNMNSSPTRELEMFTVLRSGLTSPFEYSVTTDAIIGHQAADGVMAIATANASSPTSITSYSSRGGSTIYTNFATQSKITRQSLDGTGIDGVSNRVGQLGYFSSPFYGTSAASPHAAAIAALVLQADPTLTPAQVAQVMADTATDINSPGYDVNAGIGLYNALAAVYKVYTPSQTDLRTQDDHGIDDADNITNDDTPTITGTVPAASYVRLFVDGNPSSTTQLGAGVTSFSLTPSSLSDGPHAITVRVSSGSGVALSNNSNASQALNVTIDTVAPNLNDVDFNFDTASQNVTAVFDSNVAATVQNTDLNLINQSTNTPIPSSTIGVDAANNSAVFTFAGYPYGALPDGHYSATIPATGITDIAGNALSDLVELAFFFMAGDADHNATVDAADLAILSANWNQSGRTFSQGDFSYDGRVDVEDFKILTARYQTTLAPAQPIFSTSSLAAKRGARVADSVLS